MEVLTIKLEGHGAWPDLNDQEEKIVHIQGGGEIAFLPGGMESGAPSIALRLNLTDGKTLIWETSFVLLQGAVRAMEARILRDEERDNDDSN